MVLSYFSACLQLNRSKDFQAVCLSVIKAHMFQRISAFSGLIKTPKHPGIGDLQKNPAKCKRSVYLKPHFQMETVAYGIEGRLT